VRAAQAGSFRGSRQQGIFAHPVWDRFASLSLKLQSEAKETNSIRAYSHHRIDLSG
jgi:hypothetical protein